VSLLDCPRTIIALTVSIISINPSVSFAQDTQASTVSADAQGSEPLDTRTQYPAFLKNSFFAMMAGTVSYSFSSQQLDPGYRVDSVSTPGAAIGFVLFGHEFNKYLSAQIAYRRPVKYVEYVDINGTGISHSVWTTFGHFTVSPRAPLNDRVWLYGEAGLGITNRSGFAIGGNQVVNDERFTSIVFGGGVEYHASPSWHFLAGALYVPASTDPNEPGAFFMSGGFRYTMRALPADEVAANARTSWTFPLQAIQVQYAGGGFGLGLTHVFSHDVPIFWNGDVHASGGLGVRYERNVFHTRKVFALDLGVSAHIWQSELERNRFAAFSGYPLLRFTLVRGTSADFFVWYSLAGPTFITNSVIDSAVAGPNHFTFQDSIGAGMFVGRGRHVTITAGIAHYSNGNIFATNPGIATPLAIGIGYVY
jgi:hypothetical protein